MKKALVILTLGLSSLTAMAGNDVYLGGNIGFWRNASDDVTTVSIQPEIGYRLSSRWSMGTSLGYQYQKSDDYSAHSFVMTPYVRFVYFRSSAVSLFLDGLGSIKSTKVVDYNSYTAWRAGIRPGISINLAQRVSFVATIGFLGYEGNSDHLNHFGFTDKAGFSINADNISVGFCYGF